MKLEVLGDFIIFLPSLQYYRKIFERRKISLLISHPVNYTIALRCKELGLIDEIILLDTAKFTKNIFYRISSSMNIRRQRFGTAIYHNYFRKNIGDFIVKITKAKRRIGFAGWSFEMEQKKIPLGTYTEVFREKSETNEFERSKGFLEFLGGSPIISYEPWFPIRHDDLKYFENNIKPRVSGYSGYAIVYPGAGLPMRKWPIKNYAEVAAHLLKKNVLPVVCFDKTSEHDVEMIAHATDNKAMNIREKTTIFDLAGIISKSLFYVGNDTGPLQIAASLHVPVIGIMGLGAFGIFFPYGDLSRNKIVYDKQKTCFRDAWACAANTPKDEPAPCVRDVPVAEVLKEIDSMLSQKP